MSRSFADIWQGVLDKDPQAWHELVNLLEPLVYAVARRTGLSLPEADDCAQEVARAVSHRDESAEVVSYSFALQLNQPNPFNPATAIFYSLAQDGRVRLEIYNILGARVVTLVDEHQSAGYHTADWDASALASGVYFYRISTDGFTATRKMLLLK